MRLFLAVLVGKLVRQVVKLRGGGSAYPGRIALLIEPRLLTKTLDNFPQGIVYVSGSNGKSTTTTFIVSVLESQGLKVFTNASGSNMPRGIASAIVNQASMFGQVDADIAVIEVDEGYAETISSELIPNWFVLTNIQIDQLNRFFEPDRVFQMLLDAAGKSTHGVIFNGTDANLMELASRLVSIDTFQISASAKALRVWPEGALAAPIFGKKIQPSNKPVLVTVEEEHDGVGEFAIEGRKIAISLPGSGLHFALASALALAVAQRVTGDEFLVEYAKAALESQPTVYGRGEVATYKGVSFQIMMMKNPPSMQANLVALGKTQHNIWIAVDEGTPDPSWIYDIDFSGISGVEVISGSMAWHLALRLRYEGIPVKSVVPDSKTALQVYVDYLAAGNAPGVLLSNYEQMMFVRKQIGLHDLEGGRS